MSEQLLLFPEWMSFAVVFPAKMSAEQERERGSRASGPGSGSRCETSSRPSNREQSSSRTSRAERGGGCAVCGPTCTLSAIERAPSRYLPLMSVRPTSGGGSSSSGSGSGSAWPTPSASSYGTNQGGSAGRVGPVRPSLETLVRWPTPAARDWKDGRASPKTMARNSRPLNEVVNWATPGARDDRGPAGKGYVERGNRTDLPTQVGASGKLNPAWVEALMGFPSGWTDIDGPLPAVPSSTKASRRARSKGGKSTGERA